MEHRAERLDDYIRAFEDGAYFERRRRNRKIYAASKRRKAERGGVRSEALAEMSP